MNETNQGSKSTEVSSIPSRVTTPNDSSHRTAEAHRFIQNELEQNDGMTKDRQNVLTSALDFVARFSHPSLPQPNLNVLDTEEDLVSGSTPPELLYMMLPGTFDAHETDSKTFHWPDHITGPTLQRMLLYLIDNEGNDQTALHYRAMLMQYLGNMSYSWNLTAFASRMLMSLNLHAVETTDEIDDETQASLYWCYYLDKVLSCLFVRQPSLPKLRIDPASMIPVNSANPLQTTVKIMVEMAKIQEEVLEMQLNQDVVADKSRVDAIVISADSLLALIKETRSSVPLEFQLDFDAAEFGHAAVLANVFKCSRWSRVYQHRCLDSARKALTVLAAMLDREDQQSDTADQYPSFLTWTVLLYPLTPYFVLFCNVVASSHKPDFDLMRHVTESMSRFIDANEWIHKVHGLFHDFLVLCDPLMGQTVSDDMTTGESELLLVDGANLGYANSTEERLIWELSASQPSLDWFNVPLLRDSF
ncbi:hypothetical protein N7453_001577 [Penicillium expansum]|nr:hypothetical protein N7453_001577 [Penicillium expansum]